MDGDLSNKDDIHIR